MLYLVSNLESTFRMIATCSVTKWSDTLGVPCHDDICVYRARLHPKKTPVHQNKSWTSMFRSKIRLGPIVALFCQGLKASSRTTP